MLFNLTAQNFFWLLISIFSVWRLTTLVCYEAGPFNVVTRLRKFFYKVKMGSLIECFHCTSFWMSVIFVAVAYKWSTEIILLIPGIAGAVSILQKALGYNLNLNDNEED